MTETGQQRQRSLLIGLGLAVMTAAVYWPVVEHGFLNFDDRVYVTDNSQVRSGLTAESVAWAFTTWRAEFWHPLTWLSHMLDCQFYGLKAGGHHFTNLLLHLVNTLLLFAVLRRMTGALWRSAMVAGLFALHPLHVETVAWVADRKDVLSALFWMLTLWAYARYAGKSEVQSPRSKVWYTLALVFFALGLMSKPMLVTLPFALLLLDYWPLRRWVCDEWQVSSDKNRNAAGAPPVRRHLSRVTSLVREKVPFFVLTILAGGVALAAQKGGSMVLSLDQLSWGSRIGNALISYVRYMGKTIWPAHLAVYYPHPWFWPGWQVAGACWMLAGISVLVLRAARGRPYLLMGWLWYLGTLLPVIGLVQIGNHALADRYTYIPLIGIFILAVWSIAELMAAWQQGLWAARLLGGVVLIGCMGCTWFQLKHWQDDITLFEHTLAVTANNYVAHDNLGVALSQQGKVQEAIGHLEEALRLNPNHADAHNNLGVTLLQQGRVSEAIDHFEQALRLRPELARARANLGMALVQQGRFPDAVTYLEQALQLRPQDFDSHSNLGKVLLRLGRVPEGVTHLEQALRLKPDDANTHVELGSVLFQLGRVPEAAGHLEQALRLKPQDGDLRYNLGRALLQLGRLPEAIGHLEQARQLKPDDADAQMNLGIAFFQQGDAQRGIEYLETALRLKPDGVETLMNLGIALFQLGRLPEGVGYLERALQLKPEDGDVRRNLGVALSRMGAGAASQGRWSEAVQHCQRVVELNPDNAQAQDALGVALSQAGRFTEASQAAQKAADLAEAAGQTEPARAYRERLTLYQAGQPYTNRSARDP